MNTEIKAASETCASCQYWSCQCWSSDAKVQLGECRRHAPQMLVFHDEGDIKFESRFPATLASDWCGDSLAK